MAECRQLSKRRQEGRVRGREEKRKGRGSRQEVRAVSGVWTVRRHFTAKVPPDCLVNLKKKWNNISCVSTTHITVQDLNIGALITVH